MPDSLLSVPIVLDEVDLYVTMACNLKCSFCSVRANEYARPALPLARVLEIVDEARALGMQQLHLTGGEPALRPDLEQIIRHAAQLGVAARLISNGTLLDRERLGCLRAAGLDSLMVSLDGLEQTHNALRGSCDAWRRTLDCVRAARDMGFRTRVSAVAFRPNLAEIPALMQLAAEIGVDIFSIFLGSPLGRGMHWKAQVIAPDEWRAFIAALAADVAAARFGSTMEIIVEQGFLWADTAGFDLTAIKGRGTGCRTLLAESDYLIVRGDGNLYPCVFYLHDGPPLGNVAGAPLRDVLEQARQAAAYAEFAEAPEACAACAGRVVCHGGCRGYAQLYTGDWRQPDPRCARSDDVVLPRYYPLCPIAKLNLRTGLIGGSSEQALLLGDAGDSTG